ncbi:hypothetical protein GE21DRAFT_1327396 [Neurospora crassa]|nr:hypothetical protein GE21DRAFT_1327396 [Neurospora crassa]
MNKNRVTGNGADKDWTESEEKEHNKSEQMGTYIDFNFRLDLAQKGSIWYSS